MKIIYLLAFVVACHGALIRREVVDLPAPTIVSSTIMSDGTFGASWGEVKNEDEKDPITGYKLKIWEVTPSTAKKTEHSLVTDTQKLTIEIKVNPAVDNAETPRGKLTEILTSPTETTAVTEPLKSGATYEFRVVAYTRRGEGHMSAPISIVISQ